MDEHICPICYDKLDDNIIKLRCGHIFHYECILHQYRTTNKRICPYCRCYGGYIELKNGVFPLKNIHKEYNELHALIYENNQEELNKTAKKYINSNYCECIIIKGKNIGSQCKKKKIKDSDFCFIHNKG
jgi:hypothetical protein